MSGLSQAGLAYLAGVSRETVRRAETGMTKPKLDTAARIAGALNTPVAVAFPFVAPAAPPTYKQVATVDVMRLRRIRRALDAGGGPDAERLREEARADLDFYIANAQESAWPL